MGYWAKLFSIKGRLRRRDYWLFSILVGLVNLALVYAFGRILGLEYPSSINNPSVQVLTYALTTWPMLAITAKRGHDRDISTWISAALILAFNVSAFAPSVLAAPIALWVILGMGAVSLVVIVIYGFLDGTRGPNRFGPSPKGFDPHDEKADIFS